MNGLAAIWFVLISILVLRISEAADNENHLEPLYLLENAYLADNLDSFDSIIAQYYETGNLVTAFQAFSSIYFTAEDTRALHSSRPGLSISRRRLYLTAMLPCIDHEAFEQIARKVRFQKELLERARKYYTIKRGLVRMQTSPKTRSSSSSSDEQHRRSNPPSPISRLAQRCRKLIGDITSKSKADSRESSPTLSSSLSDSRPEKQSKRAAAIRDQEDVELDELRPANSRLADVLSSTESSTSHSSSQNSTSCLAMGDSLGHEMKNVEEIQSWHQQHEASKKHLMIYFVNRCLPPMEITIHGKEPFSIIVETILSLVQEKSPSGEINIIRPFAEVLEKQCYEWSLDELKFAQRENLYVCVK